MNFCQCGCGIEIKSEKRFVSGHNKARLGTGKIIVFSNLCECGCGNIVKGRFVWGHNGRLNKGRVHICSEETKRKIGEKSKGRICSFETRKKISNALVGRPLLEETKKKLIQEKLFLMNKEREFQNQKQGKLFPRRLKINFPKQAKKNGKILYLHR
jgi:hypothetical protein